ncbi:SagB family peptide dehydrogenase [Sulfurimonas sp.]|uniref:SagB family peptide dehydrogenase n=1 Tax=Sulfurimonas sp. TaxID=2022749 RepID=UPI00356552E5
MDWQSQPVNHKLYPHFNQRFKIDDYEELKDLNLIGGITYEKKYPNGTYYLRSVPSAGGLYPCEVYIQIRGVKGLLNGIYHYEPYSASLTLLQEIEKDGVEHYFKEQNQEKGLVFMISSVYFRSSWKYRDRSIRYILLDSGHQLGSIYAALSVMGRENEVLFDFDKISLNSVFGFRDDEMFTCAIKSSQTVEKEVTKLRQQLPFVSGCDYLETNEFIEQAYKETAIYEDNNSKVPDFFNEIPKDQLKRAILNRRSIRAFRQESITKDEFDFILKDLFDFAEKNSIEIFYTVHNVNDQELGLYKSTDLIKEGDFRGKSEYLALEQKLGSQSAVTFYFTSSEVEKYQKVNILSGFIAQIIYLRAELMGIGCSGIGAYYDDECKEFLNTKNNILYLLAIGR